MILSLIHILQKRNRNLHSLYMSRSYHRDRGEERSQDGWGLCPSPWRRQYSTALRLQHQRPVRLGGPHLAHSGEGNLIPAENLLGQSHHILVGDAVIGGDDLLRGEDLDVYKRQPVTLPAQLQRVVMSIIYDEIKKGETGSREKFGEIDAYLRQAGCDCAILGCTELSVYRSLHSLPPYYIDAMEILAEQAILRCGKALRNV